jgi:hypothetical protein
MSSNKKMRITFFYSDRNIYDIAKGRVSASPAPIVAPNSNPGVGPSEGSHVSRDRPITIGKSHSSTTEKEMIDWANKFYEKYGCELECIPNTSVKTENDKFILKDGLSPRMFDKVTYQKFDKEATDLTDRKNKLSKDKTKEIAEIDKKIANVISQRGVSEADYLKDIELLRKSCKNDYIGGNIFEKVEIGEKQNQIKNRLAVIFCKFDYKSVKSIISTVAEVFGSGGHSIPICSNIGNSCTPFIVIDIETCTIGTLAHEIAHAGAMMTDLDVDKKKGSLDSDSIMNYDNLGKNTNPKNLKLQSSLTKDSETLCEDRLKTAFFIT